MLGLMLGSLMNRINWRFVLRQGGLGGFGAAMAVTGAWLLAPYAGNSSYALLALAGFMAIDGAKTVALALTTSSSGHWSPSRLARLRRLAARGWVILPDPDGGYMAYGPNGKNRWIDHWFEVESFEEGLK